MNGAGDCGYVILAGVVLGKLSESQASFLLRSALQAQTPIGVRYLLCPTLADLRQPRRVPGGDWGNSVPFRSADESTLSTTQQAKRAALQGRFLHASRTT